MKLVEPPSCSSPSTIVLHRPESPGTVESPRSRTASMAACSSAARRPSNMRCSRTDSIPRPSSSCRARSSSTWAKPPRRFSQRARLSRRLRRNIHVHSSSAWFTGFIPDLPTPFDAADAIDLEAFAASLRAPDRGRRSAHRGLRDGRRGADALAGRAGARVIRAAVDVARGRVRIIAGAMSNATSHAIELARRAEAAGADAVMSVVPAYNKPMQEGMLALPGHRRCDRFAGDPARRSLPHAAPARRRDASAPRRDPASSWACVMAAATSPARCASPDSCRQAFACCPATTPPLSASSRTAATARDLGGYQHRPGSLPHRSSRRSRQGRLQSARYLDKRLDAAYRLPLARKARRRSNTPLSALGLMSAGTRLPIVPLDAAARRGSTGIRCDRRRGADRQRRGLMCRGPSGYRMLQSVEGSHRLLPRLEAGAAALCRDAG